MTVGKDPRAEKHRDYRLQGHCRRANCGICHPEKRWGPRRDHNFAAKLDALLVSEHGVLDRLADDRPDG